MRLFNYSIIDLLTNLDNEYSRPIRNYMLLNAYVKAENVGLVDSQWEFDELDMSLSYVPAKSKNRQNIKLGKGLRKIIHTTGLEFPNQDKAVEILVNDIKSRDVSKFSFKEEDFAEVPYCEMDFSNLGVGSLANSCMNGKWSLVKFYTKNSTSKVLTLTDNEGKLLGRGILWKGVQIIESSHEETLQRGEEVTFLDRIYGSDVTIEMFKKYCSANGIMYKLEQSYSNRKWFVYNDVKMKLEVCVKVDEWEKHPYLDTMTFLDKEHGVLYNTEEDYDYVALTSTEGTALGAVCSQCGDDIDYDDVINIDGATYCECCCEYSQTYEEFIPANEAVWCEEIDDYVFECDAVDVRGRGLYPETSGDIVRDLEGEWIHCDDSRVLEHGEYCHEDDCMECEDCGEYFINEEINEYGICECCQEEREFNEKEDEEDEEDEDE